MCRPSVSRKSSSFWKLPQVKSGAGWVIRANTRLYWLLLFTHQLPVAPEKVALMVLMQEFRCLHSICRCLQLNRDSISIRNYGGGVQLVAYVRQDFVCLIHPYLYYPTML
jgi:hypothetical protein